jgi:hypothetical protein
MLGILPSLELPGEITKDMTRPLEEKVKGEGCDECEAQKEVAEVIHCLTLRSM